MWKKFVSSFHICCVEYALSSRCLLLRSGNVVNPCSVNEVDVNLRITVFLYSQSYFAFVIILVNSIEHHVPAAIFVGVVFAVVVCAVNSINLFPWRIDRDDVFTEIYADVHITFFPIAPVVVAVFDSRLCVR